MSRYNGWWDFVKPFYDLFFMVVVVPLFLVVFAILWIIYGQEKAMEMMDEWAGVDELNESADGG